MNAMPSLDVSAPSSRGRRLPLVPAAAFGIVLGLAGLTNSWRAAAHLWNVPAAIGEAIGAVTVIVWAALIVCFALKWLFLRSGALQELSHPIQCCFIGLVGVSTMLVSPILAPYAHAFAEALFWVGAVWTVAFAVWRTGALWRGGRDPSTTTAVLYLPTVAGSYVLAIAGAAFGYQDISQLAFGAGFFSWLAIESVLINRLLTSAEMPEPMRPTMGIQLAPPAVGTVAYLSATNGAPDMLAHAMFGYAMLQLLLMLRILPWVMKQPFVAGYWAFSFGLTAISTAGIRLVDRGDSGIVQLMALPLFVFATLMIALLAIMTLVQLFRGKLFPLQLRTA